MGTGSTIRISARVVTRLEPEAVFDRLSGSSALSWIESPWELQSPVALKDGASLTWSLGDIRTVTTPVHIDRPQLMSWSNLGLEGRIEVQPSSGETVVSYWGAFPASWSTIKDSLFMLFMKSNHGMRSDAGAIGEPASCADKGLKRGHGISIGR